MSISELELPLACNLSVEVKTNLSLKTKDDEEGKGYEEKKEIKKMKC